MEGIFFKTPPPVWKFQLSLINFLKCFGLGEPPTSWEISIPSVGGVDYGDFLELHNGLPNVLINENEWFNVNWFESFQQVDQTGKEWNCLILDIKMDLMSVWSICQILQHLQTKQHPKVIL